MNSRHSGRVNRDPPRFGPIRLADALRDRLPPRAIVRDAATIAPWTTDWRGRWHGVAAAMFEPASVDEVRLIVTTAAALGVALVPQGGNTSMVGGATPPADGSAAILSLRRMNAIRSIDADANVVVAEAGLILAHLHDAAIAVGRRFPLTLGARGSATVGGLCATNAGGTQVLRFGTMRGLVAGLEAVLPDGSLYEGLVALKKDNRGYDLTHLLIGAEGTLGVVTAATLRLVPGIAARGVAWATVASPHAALALLRRFEAVTRELESFELMPKFSVDAVLRHIPDTRAAVKGDHRWHILIELTSGEAPGGAGDPAATIERVLAGALGDGLIADATIAASEAQAEAMWRIRDSISESERALGPAAQHDISVPVAAMPDFLIDAAAACEARFPGSSAGGFGHLGDGNVHFHVRAPAGVDATGWYRDEAPVVTRFVDDLVVAAGGSISAEHGIGQMKLAELERLSSPARLHALRAIKAALDPQNILNPGKLVRPAARVRLAPERASA